MSDDKLISAHLKAILSGLSAHGISHLTEIESDLAQTNLLLEEAITKLVASFMAINGAISVHQEMLEAMLGNGAEENEATAGMLAISEELGRHINDAVTSLQFEDMTRQLIERSTKRVAGLRGILSSLGSSASGINGRDEPREQVALLKSMGRQIEMQNAELNEMLLKTVRQKHMDSGEVELF